MKGLPVRESEGVRVRATAALVGQFPWRVHVPAACTD